MQEILQHFQSSVTLECRKHIQRSTSGPRKGHSGGGGRQQRWQAEQLPDRKQLSAEAKQPVQPEWQAARRSTIFQAGLLVDAGSRTITFSWSDSDKITYSSEGPWVEVD